jgi:hypothetical protein
MLAVMNKADLLKSMSELHACPEATEYVQDHASDSAKEIGQTCDRPDWLIWFLVRQPTARAKVIKFSFSCADRAVRQYAPKALEADGLTAEAEALRALPEIVDERTAYAADNAAYAAANAAYAAYAAYAANAANAAYAANAANAAYANAANAANAVHAGAAHAAAAASAAHAAGADAAAAYAAERTHQLKDLHAIWCEVV